MLDKRTKDFSSTGAIAKSLSIIIFAVSILFLPDDLCNNIHITVLFQFCQTILLLHIILFVYYTEYLHSYKQRWLEIYQYI